MKSPPHALKATPMLRQRAESRLREMSKQSPERPGRPGDAADARRLLHELQVHQIELEMQNEELRKARDEMEAALDKYSDLYDFAPVGYFTFANHGVIRLVNFTGASLAGIERSRLNGQSFGRLLAAEQRPAFDQFLKRVFAGATKQAGEFTLLSPGRAPRFISLEAQRLPNGLECRVVMVDVTEHRRAEASVSASEVRFRRLFEAAHDGILLLDPGTRQITDANPFMTQLLGYPRDQLVGKELFEIGLLKDEAASQAMFQKLTQHHEVRYEDLPLESQDGRHQEVEVVANLYSEGGHAVIQCNIRDISERKRAELALNRLAAIVESSNDAIVSVDLHGTVTSWNKGARKIFGYTGREIVGTSIARLLPPDRLNDEKLILGTVRRGGGVQHFETRRRTKAGQTIDVSITASPLRDARGRVIGASKVARDISDRKHAEAALRRNEALFSALIAQVPVGVYVVDARFRMLQLNPTALRVFCQVHPLVGRKFSEVLRSVWPERAAAKLEARFRHTMKTGEPYRSSDFTERRRDLGVTENYEWQIQRVTLPAGEFGVVCFFNDITERVRNAKAQRRLDRVTATNAKLRGEIVRREAGETALRLSERHKQKLLEQSHHLQKRLRQYSHQILIGQEDLRKKISRELHDDISQLLVGINVHLEVFARAAAIDPQGVRRTIAPLCRLVEKALKVVHRFARELRPSSLDDLGLIPALRSYIAEFPRRKGRQIRFTAYAGADTLSGDQRTMLYRVAQEALTNAAKHAQASLIKVRLVKAARAVSLEVADNGRSFAVERIGSAQWGNHLGLVGMRERVEMLGGRFSVESEAGTGTTIRAEVDC